MEEKKKCCCPAGVNSGRTEEDEISIPETVSGKAEGKKECGCRTRVRSEQEMKDLVHRLNRVEGQIRGIRAMVEEERYCVDILTQVAAARSALNGFSQALLDQHIRTCVADRLQDGDTEVVDELTSVIRKLMK